MHFRKLCKLGREYPLGIGHGAGAIIFGTTLLSRLTGERQWLETAVEFAERLEEARIRESPEFDLIWGNAGLLVALSRLYQASQHEVALEKGRICVEVLANRFRDDVGWRGSDGQSLLGFAHGSAGVAFAAAGFASQTRCEKARELAIKALQFDRRFYLGCENNWPVHAADQKAQMSAWCAGLPGMLLARLAVAEISGHLELSDEIDRILRHFPEQ